MNKLIAVAVAAAFVSIASPAQASESCTNILVTLCAGDSGVSVGPSSPPSSAAPAPAKAAPAPATPAPTTTPKPVAPKTTQAPVKTQQPAPAPKLNTQVAPAAPTATAAPTTQAPMTTPAPKAESKPKPKSAGAAWRVPVGVVIVFMIAIVLVLYAMYRIGKREAESSFNAYMMDVMRLTRRSRAATLH